MRSWIRIVGCLFCAAILTVRMSAQPVRDGKVVAELVAAEGAIVPGQTTTVALRLQHDPHWHTYWINPGTGYPTSVRWTLPEGYVVGDIQWPAPSRIYTQGEPTGFGYEGEIFLPMTLTVPTTAQPGSTVELRAAVEWLMCENTCIPGEAALTLRLAVAERAAPHPKWGAPVAQTVNQLPKALPGWTATAALVEPQELEIRWQAPGGAAAWPVADLYFFPENAVFDYTLAQTFAASADGREIVLRGPVADTFGGSPTEVVGVLRTQTQGALDRPALAVKISVGAQPAPAAASVPGATTPATAVTPAAAASAGGGGLGLLGLIGAAFLGGLILNVMPCVFPVLGIKILGFVEQGGKDPKKVVAHGLVFTFGVLCSFWLLAGVLLALKAGGQGLGWGFQLQEPAFVFGIIVALLLFALNLSGVFEVGQGVATAASGVGPREGFLGSFFSGVLATVVATPCSAPFVGLAIPGALAAPVWESVLIFTAMGIGLSAPYLVLSFFPKLTKFLPRPGAWMETFKQVLAFPLYGTVAYLLWVLAVLVDPDPLLRALFALVLVAAGAWVFGRWAHAGGAGAWVARLVALLLAAGGVVYGWPPAASAAPVKAATGPVASGVTEAGEVVWEPWSEARVVELQAQGRAIYVDFTAAWCATCLVNKGVVFGNTELKQTFRQQNVALLKADWTRRDPVIAAYLAKIERGAVPVNIVYRPGGPASGQILPEVLTPQIVLDALAGK